MACGNGVDGTLHIQTTTLNLELLLTSKHVHVRAKIYSVESSRAPQNFDVAAL